MHVKLCCLSSEKHCFGQEMVFNLIASKFQKFSGGGSMLPDPPTCCVLTYAPLTWPLQIWWLQSWSMPPTRVCTQCKAAVPVRWKTCEHCVHVFRSKQKAECSLREKHTSTITCTDAPRVWHFSAFHWYLQLPKLSDYIISIAIHATRNMSIAKLK